MAIPDIILCDIRQEHESAMFSKSTTAISFLFFLFLHPQIAKVQHIHELPGLDSINDPAVHLRDNQIRNSPRQIQDEFLDRESKVELQMCEPNSSGDFEWNGQKYRCVPVNSNDPNEEIKRRN